VTRLSGTQIRAGRALLRWSADRLAEVAEVGVATVRRAEASDGTVETTRANEQAIRRALEEAGVEFIEPNGGGPGVRLNEA